MAEAEKCLFCRIAAGEVPADRVYEDEDVVVFDVRSVSLPPAAS